MASCRHTLSQREAGVSRPAASTLGDRQASVRCARAETPARLAKRHRGTMSRVRRSTLRSVLGKADLDALLSERERLNEDLQQIIDE